MEGDVDGISNPSDVVVPHEIAHETAINEDKGEDLDPEWVKSFKRKMEDEPRKTKASFSSCSIHRIPQNFHHLDQRATCLKSSQ